MGLPRKSIFLILYICVNALVSSLMSSKRLFFNEISWTTAKCLKAKHKEINYHQYSLHSYCCILASKDNKPMHQKIAPQTSQGTYVFDWKHQVHEAFYFWISSQ